jgi:hypothetical protein
VALRRTIIAIGMLGWMAGEAVSAGPQQCREGLCHTVPENPIAPGRPSPPPCCADGVCYPNYMTWGHYATRWRRWPIEFPTPVPEELRPPAPLAPDVRAFEPPTAEEEDQRAPPPTPPRAEEAAETAPPAGGPPAGGPPTQAPPAGAPTERPAERPATTPLAPPARGAAQPPTGDWDPPPELPFGAPVIGTGRDVRAAGRSDAAPAARPNRRPRPGPSDDPPPELPIALASWAN